jgi:thioesterase domain-containing protein/acyl carrier protein
MVPAAFVVLDAIPLTPNGKVDRRALARIDVEGDGAPPAAAPRRPPRAPLERRLAATRAEVLGVPEVGATDSFFGLGGHSLLTVRLVSGIEHRLGRRVPLAAVFAAPTVEAMAARLRRGWEPGGGPLVPLRAGGSAPPLYCVHGAGGGVFGFAELARRLDPELPVWGLEARGLDGDEPPAGSVEEMATAYLAAIRQLQPHGPYRLAGWSMGGLVAFEMARRLAEANEQVPVVALLDSLPGAEMDWPAAERLDGALLAGFGRELGLPWGVAEAAAGRRAGRGGGADGALGRLLAAAAEAGTLPPDLDRDRLRALFAVYRANVSAHAGYAPRPYPGRILLIQTAAARPADRRRQLRAWRALAAEVATATVPGDHFELLRPPAVEAVAASLERHLGHLSEPPAADAVRPAAAEGGTP